MPRPSAAAARTGNSARAPRGPARAPRGASASSARPGWASCTSSVRSHRPSTVLQPDLRARRGHRPARAAARWRARRRARGPAARSRSAGARAHRPRRRGPGRRAELERLAHGRGGGAILAGAGHADEAAARRQIFVGAERGEAGGPLAVHGDERGLGDGGERAGVELVCVVDAADADAGIAGGGRPGEHGAAGLAGHPRVLHGVEPLHLGADGLPDPAPRHGGELGVGDLGERAEERGGEQAVPHAGVVGDLQRQLVGEAGRDDLGVFERARYGRRRGRAQSAAEAAARPAAGSRRGWR